MKVCFSCRQPKPLDEFYDHPGTADGKLGKCKTCTRRDTANNRANKIDKVRAYDRDRAKTRIEHTTKNTKRWRAENPEKWNAHVVLNNAVRSKRILRQPCERCGSDKAHAHHDDYSKPLDVMWLCALHHKERHKELTNLGSNNDQQSDDFKFGLARKE